jgi:hypothetical protein
MILGMPIGKNMILRAGMTVYSKAFFAAAITTVF